METVNNGKKNSLLQRHLLRFLFPYSFTLLIFVYLDFVMVNPDLSAMARFVLARIALRRV